MGLLSKTSGIVALLLVGSLVPLSGQSALFVNSAPIRAEVTVNGTVYGTTPLLVRDLDPGTYEITVVKPRHTSATTRIQLGADEVRAAEVRLEPDVFVATFSADEVVLEGQSYDQQESTFEFTSGTYGLSADGRSLMLDPVYPNESALRAMRIATIAGAVAAVIATVEDTLVGEGRDYFTSYLPSPATIAAWTLTAGAGGFWLALEAEKHDYERKTGITQYEGGLTPREAERRYLQAEEALEAGNLSLALDNYTRVVADGADSEYVPDALYKSAQIYSVSGDVELAARLLERLARHMPDPNVYDRALKSLADVYVILERPQDAIAALRRMLFYDPTYQPGDIQAEIDEIRESQQGGEE